VCETHKATNRVCDIGTSSKHKVHERAYLALVHLYLLTRGLGFFFLSFDTSGAKLGHRATGYFIHVHIVLFQYAYSVHFLVDSEGRGYGGSVSGDTDTQEERWITKDGNVEVLANVFLELASQDFVADREEIVHVNGNNQSILPLFDGFLNSKQMRLAWNLRESKLFHNGSEFGVPRSSSLLETVDAFLR